MNHEEVWFKAYCAELSGGSSTQGAPSLADRAVFQYNKRFPNAEACMWENCPCTPKEDVNEEAPRNTRP